MIAILGVIKTSTCSCTVHYVFDTTVAHILTHTVNLTFGPKSGLKNECQAQAGFGLVISGSDRVRVSKWDPFTTLVYFSLQEKQMKKIVLATERRNVQIHRCTAVLR